ncbi:sulfatase [bacterium]|nr:sulfatase [bacterium]
MHGIGLTAIGIGLTAIGIGLTAIGIGLGGGCARWVCPVRSAGKNGRLMLRRVLLLCFALLDSLMQRMICATLFVYGGIFGTVNLFCCDLVVGAGRPNILIAIADDQSYPHTSAYGDPVIKTPAFDRVARNGVLFRNAFTPAPGCSPMRAAFLTGREIWQNREAGTHASTFPRDLPVFTEQLASAGYHVGMTGKGWSPGKAIDWPHNPAGKAYTSRKVKAADRIKGISSNDYAGNFEEFLKERSDDQPFCFWFGASEPHRTYQEGVGAKHGLDPAKIRMPGFLPGSMQVRSDVADYLFEIQWFDQHLGRMLDQLADSGELENTMVIVTSDNGMPFPRAKANLYEFGIHMPLAIAWPARVSAGQDTDELVSLIDVTRSIFAAAGVEPAQAEQLSGRNLLSRIVKDADKVQPAREFVFSGRERHSSSRFNSLSYPCRCVRSKTHLYIRNFTPERWPAGTPQKYLGAKYDQEGKLVESRLSPEHGGYHDIDNGPTLMWMIANRAEPAVGKLLQAAVAKRPAEELFDIRQDPDCLSNLAGDPKFARVQAKLSDKLTEYLTETGDLRQTDPVAGQVWETYPRVSSLRWFPVPDWYKEDPTAAPQQLWLEKRRPRE